VREKVCHGEKPMVRGSGGADFGYLFGRGRKSGKPTSQSVRGRKFWCLGGRIRGCSNFRKNTLLFGMLVGDGKGGVQL